MHWARPSDTILLFIFTYTLIAYLSMYMHYSYLAIKLYIPLRYYFLYWEPVMIKVIYETFILAVIYRSLHSHNLWVTLIANINTLKCDCNSRCFFLVILSFIVVCGHIIEITLQYIGSLVCIHFLCDLKLCLYSYYNCWYTILCTWMMYTRWRILAETVCI